MAPEEIYPTGSYAYKEAKSFEALYLADVLRYDPLNVLWKYCANSLGKHDTYWGCAL